MSFEAQLTQISTNIKSSINALVERLRAREKSLLKQLDDIRDKYKQEKEKETQCMSELNKLIKFTQENVASEILREFHGTMVESVRRKLKEIESELKSKEISFVSDSSLLVGISQFGKINVTSTDACLPVAEYKGKVRPVLRIGGNGSAEGKFKNPFGLILENRSKNIYVADQSNNRVQVLDEEGKFLFKFGEMNGPGGMKSPLQIAIYKEKVFVTQFQAHCVLVYDLNGNFAVQIGNEGSEEGQFNSPFGITINRYNGDIYVCDAENSRIQIFSEKYSFKSQFGKETLQSPTDIKLTIDNIYVLSNKKPFLIIFNYNLTPIQNIVSSSISNHLTYPYCFTIDGAGNIIISDHGSKSVLIFNEQGELLHSLKESLSRPSGVSIDFKGRIIVIEEVGNLLIF